MTDIPAVSVRHDGAVAVITIERAQQRNTLTLDVLIGLIAALKEVAELGSVRAVVLTGAGRDFSLGGDHRDFAEALRRPAEEAREFCRGRTQLLAEIVLQLHALPKPVIAAINGQASGAGISLALACDLRVMDARAKIHIAYGAIGASTDGGMSWFLPRLIGESQSMRLLLLQPIVRAPEAHELGLVHEITTHGQELARAIELAHEITASPQHSMLSAKMMLRAGAATELERHLVAEHEQFVDGLATQDFQMAIRALDHDEPQPGDSAAP